MKRSHRNAQQDDRLADFDEFVGRVESRLRIALVAAYGTIDGRAATVDALSWAWEHWGQLQSMDNPVGYLYRVGQSATRRYVVRPIPVDRDEPTVDDVLGISPELADAVKRLPGQRRTVVMLVHAFGWSPTSARLDGQRVATSRSWEPSLLPPCWPLASGS